MNRVFFKVASLKWIISEQKKQNKKQSKKTRPKHDTPIGALEAAAMSWPVVKAASHLWCWHFWHCSLQLLRLTCSVSYLKLVFCKLCAAAIALWVELVYSVCLEVPAPRSSGEEGSRWIALVCSFQYSVLLFSACGPWKAYEGWSNQADLVVSYRETNGWGERLSAAVVPPLNAAFRTPEFEGRGRDRKENKP